MAQPKVLHFFPDHYNWGGIQVYLANTLPKLKQQFEIVVVCTENSKLFHRLKEEGIKVYGLPFFFKKKHLLASWFRKPLLRTLDVGVHQKLLKILAKEQPDMVHVHSGRIEHACIKKAGFKLIYTYHGYGAVYNIETARSKFHQLYYKLMRPLFSNLIPYLDGMTIVSQYEKDRLYRGGFIPPSFEPEVLYNGIPQPNVPQEQADALRKELGIPKEAKVICLASRLMAAKNAKAFIPLAHKILALKPQGMKIFFLVAGDGNQARRFSAAFGEGGDLAEHGVYLGFRSDVPVLLSVSHLSVSTSLQEGFGLRVIESFIQGSPFAGYHVGGQVELVPEQYKSLLLSPAGDEDALARSILKVLTMTEEEQAKMSDVLRTTADNFTLDKHVAKMMAFYQKVLSH